MFHTRIKHEETINTKDFLSTVFQFSVSIEGRWNGGVSDQNPVWVSNKNKILSEFLLSKFIFDLKLDVISFNGTKSVEKTIDITSYLMKHVKTEPKR